MTVYRKKKLATRLAEIEYDNNELPSAEPTLPARMVSNASQLKAMDCDELAAWLQAQDADPFDAQVKRNLSAFLGIDIVAMRRHRLADAGAPRRVARPRMCLISFLAITGPW